MDAHKESIPVAVLSEGAKKPGYMELSVTDEDGREFDSFPGHSCGVQHVFQPFRHRTD